MGASKDSLIYHLGNYMTEARSVDMVVGKIFDAFATIKYD